MKIACIILAAGKSTRMKQQKMLLPFKGSTVIENVAKASIQSNATQTKIVTGNIKTQIEQVLRCERVQFIHNSEFEKGMLSSVQCGVNGVKDCDAFFILPGDQAFVTSACINQLISAYESSDKGLLIPTYTGKKGHPVLIKATYSKQIMTLDHNIGLRQLFHENEEDISFVEIDSDEILFDLDIPEDYANALKRLSSEK